jgi:signal transduction histidine kinase
MQDMAGSCKRLDHAIAKLLAYGATAANKVKLSVEIGDLTQAMRRAASMWTPTFEGKGIRFDYQIPEEPIRFAFDRQKVGQVVSNLLENASHFTPAGGTVSLVVRQQFWERRSTQSRPPGPERRSRNVVAPNAAFIAVSDTGTGIAPEYHQEIFEDFFSMATETVPQGTGLGLSIARYLVQAHGGKIWVESKSGEGASFFVLLPFAMPEPRVKNPPAALAAAE